MTNLEPTSYVLTQDSVNIVWDGEPYIVRKNAPNFQTLRKACVEEDWETVKNNLTVPYSLENWAKGLFTIQGETILYDGSELPKELNNRILNMATRGEDPNPIFEFWKRLVKNPSYRSVNQLWSFLQHQGIPLTEDGCFLAYKGVRHDYTDSYTRSHNNSPGCVLSMPRNQISDDPEVPCHVGFHVGALYYARTFSDRVIICKVDPEHVVCVPRDHSFQKMRVCTYEVIGNYGSELPSTTFEDERAISISSKDYDDEELEDDEELKDEYDDIEEEEDYEAEEEVAEAYADQIEEEALVVPEFKTKPKKQRLKGWSKFHRMDIAKLMEQSLGDLRQYATYGMAIVGASKIPGGKTALVACILEVRKED